MAKIFIENSDYKIVKIEQGVHVTKDGVIKAIDKELKKLRLDEMQSITEQEYCKEPVGGIVMKDKNGYPMAAFNTTDLEIGDFLYTHPAPAKEFVTLTDDDISRVIGNMRKDNHGNLFNDFDFAYAIGQATALKNGMELSDG
jgi:hypothetical protein